LIYLENEVIDKLSAAGILAYIAVSLADGTEATTAALAILVKSRSGVMREGLKELAVEYPEKVSSTGKKKQKWRCGVVQAGVAVQNLDSERFRLFVDDIKKYWDFMNPALPFEMGGRDGAQIRAFLNDHRLWAQSDWRVALNHRRSSILKHGQAAASEPVWSWIRRLDVYHAGPLDKFSKPIGVSNGKANDTRDRNRAAVANAVANS
jgi:hypothetical protein